MLRLAGLHPGVVGARDAQLARATAHRRPPLTLRLCECAVAPSGIAGGCSAAGDGPRPKRSNLHDETRKTKQKQPFGAGEEGRNRAAGSSGERGSPRRPRRFPHIPHFHLAEARRCLFAHNCRDRRDN